PSFGTPLIEHGLDGEDHAFLQLQASAVLAVVQHLGLFMEHLADAVAAIVAHHAVAVGVGMFLDDLADITEVGAGANHGDTLIQALLGNAGQSGDPVGYLANMEHLAGVTVVAILDHSDIDIHRVAILQRLVVGNTMADHVIERGADGLGEGDATVPAAVVQRRGNGFLFIDDEVVTTLVQLIGGHARLDVFPDHFQHFGGQSAGDAHAGDVFGGLDGYAHDWGNSLVLPRRLACGMD